MPTTYQSYTTERLILQPTVPAHAKHVLALLNTEKWLANIGDRNVHTLEEAAAYISNKMVPQYEEYGYGNYTVFLKGTLEYVGNCGLYVRPGLTIADIGFAFLPQHEGKGYGYEATSRIIVACREDFNVPKICAITIPVNTASRKLLEKLGLVYIKNISLPNDPALLMYYEMDII